MQHINIAPGGIFTPTNVICTLPQATARPLRFRRENRGDISARHIRPVELPLPLSTTDPPTSPATYAHFNGTESFVCKDTHNAQFKGNDGDTDHDQFNGNDGFDGEGNCDGNDTDDNDDDAAQYNDSDDSEGSVVCVGIDSNNARFHGKDNFGDSVSFEGNYDKNSHFNGMDNFVGKDTHNAQSKGNDGDTDHDQFNGNDGFDGKGNFDGNDNDRMIMTLHSTMVVMLQRVAVFALALIAIMPDSMARTILVIVLVRDDNNTDCNGNDNLNFYDNVNVNDNFNDKDSNDSQFNDHDNLYGNGIHSNNTRFHVKDNFGGSVSFEGNDNRNTHSNGNDNLNFNDNFNFHFNDNFDDQERNHSQFNDNYSNDTNSDRFPPPPPRGRKRRQTTLWSSQTGETNTSESGSLVWLPDENSALKAPEHE